MALKQFQFYIVRLKVIINLCNCIRLLWFQFYIVRLKEHRKHDNALLIINVFRCKYMKKKS